MKRALCIWLPRWPLQRLAVARAELRSRAVVLYQLHASRGARVVSYGAPLADAPAALWNADPRQGGIGAGMPLAEATALASWSDDDDAPGLHLELHDPLADRLALEALAQWCQRFSPSAGLEEGDSPESLLLDVSGLGPLFDGERALAECVVRQLQQRGLTARVAIADTPGAAWAIAHFADLEVLGTRSDTLNGARSNTLNSASSDTFNGSAAPVGSTAAILAALRVPLVVPPGRTWDAIAPLSVLALRLPPPICALLDDLGLRRIEQVAALARSTLLARFGPLVLARLDQATGAAAEAVAAQALPPERELEWLFEHPTGRREMIDAALMQLIARACQALARQGHGVLRLRCRFEPERGSSEEFVVGLFRPSASEGHVGELARLKLESARFREPVAAIRLTVLATDRLEYRQQEIFVDGRSCREEPRTLAALVDRLSNRLGAQAVLRPWLLAGAQPEFACQFQPLASLAARKNKKRRGNSPGKKQRGPVQDAATPGVPGDRPLCLRPRPLRLEVMSIAPQGPPAQFRLGGSEHRVTRVWGPERIETGWWRTRCVRRDYYQVETGNGERFWLFRELNSRNWFLHGEFA